MLRRLTPTGWLIAALAIVYMVVLFAAQTKDPTIPPLGRVMFVWAGGAMFIIPMIAWGLRTDLPECQPLGWFRKTIFAISFPLGLMLGPMGVGYVTGHLPNDKSQGDQTVYITTYGNKYHRDGCMYLRESKIQLKLYSVKSGYHPCERCW